MSRHVDEVTGIIVDAALEVHRDLGPGLFESVYESVLWAGLRERGLLAVRQAAIRIRHKDRVFDDAFRADLLVDQRVIVEIKSLERLAPVHQKQLLTYLRLSGLPVGLLINFGQSRLVDGLKRVVNFVQTSATSPMRINRL